MNTAHVSAEYHRICKALGRKPDLDQLAIWKDILAEVEPALLRMAVTDRLKQENWYPTPGDLLSTAERIEAEAAGPHVPVEPEHWRRQTVKCHLCQDTGYRTIWSPAAMSVALEVVCGTEDRQAIIRAQGQGTSACCTCELGEARSAGWVRRRGRRLKSDDPNQYCFRSPPMIAVETHLSQAEQVELLMEWARDWQPSGYVAEFDRF